MLDRISEMESFIAQPQFQVLFVHVPEEVGHKDKAEGVRPRGLPDQVHSGLEVI